MKNIFIALAFLFSAGAIAQTTKNTTSNKASQEILSSKELAERDFQALNAVIKISDPSAIGNIKKAFQTKYMYKNESPDSTDRTNYLNTDFEESLKLFLGAEKFAQLKNNKALYKKLVK